MMEILNILPRAVLLKCSSIDEKKVIDLLENKEVEIFPDGHNVIEIHFKKKEDRKVFSDLFPKVPNRKRKK